MKNAIQVSGATLLKALLISMFTGGAQAHVISEEDHHTFEHKYAESCVEQEKSKLRGSGVLLSEVEAVCDCIAKEESKRLTKEEVREYLIMGRTPISLIMKKNAAAYACIDQKK